MAEFDPDALVKKIQDTAGFKVGETTPNGVTSSPGFDPDALVHKLGGIPPSMGESAVRGGAQGLLMGYEPQVVGGAKSLFGGKYEEERNKEIAANEAAKKENPVTYGASEFAGGVAPAIASYGVLPEMEAAGVGGRMLKSAASGGLLGGLQNPGNEQPQIKARAQNAAIGIAGGTLGGMVGETITEASQSLKDWAGQRAVKAAGYIQSSLKKLSTNTTPEKLGQDAMDLGLVQTGDNVQSIADKSEKMINEVGQKIGQLYREAKDEVSYAEQHMRLEIDKKKFISQLTDAVLEKGNLPELQAGPYLDKMHSVIQEIGQKDIVDPESLFRVKKYLQNMVNWSKQNKDLPEVEVGYKAMQRVINDQIGNILDVLGQVYEAPSAKKELIELNRKFGIAAAINEGAEAGVLRSTGNRWVTPSSYLTGAAVGTGALAHAHSPLQTAGALALGAGAGLLNKGLMTYGPGIAGEGAYRAGQLGQYANKLPYGMLGSEVAKRKKELQTTEKNK